MEFITRLMAIIFVLISPYVMMLCHGPVFSLSQYWNTPYQPVFILSNAITSYFLFSTPNWKIPSFFLMLLTAFSTTEYPNTHDMLAVAFFITCTYSLYKSHRFRYYLYIYITMTLIMPISMLWGEILSIMVLCAYHGHLILYKYYLDTRNN